jgi:hypothetical protein
MDGIQFTVYENKALLLGDNFFEGGSISVDAGDEIKEGAFLKRTSGHTFDLVTDTDPFEADVSGTETPIPGTSNDVPSAVLITGVKNEGSAARLFSIRPCIAGRLRADLLHVNGIQATPEQIDLIRRTGIVPVYVNDVSRLDNM